MTWLHTADHLSWKDWHLLPMGKRKRLEREQAKAAKKRRPGLESGERIDRACARIVKRRKQEEVALKQPDQGSKTRNRFRERAGEGSLTYFTEVSDRLLVSLSRPTQCCGGSKSTVRRALPRRTWTARRRRGCWPPARCKRLPRTLRSAAGLVSCTRVAWPGVPAW